MTYRKTLFAAFACAALGMAVPANAGGGPTVPNSSEANGVNVNALAGNGLADNAVYPNAINPNAINPNAVYPNAVYPNAINPQGSEPQDIRHNDSHRGAFATASRPALRGFTIVGIELPAE